MKAKPSVDWRKVKILFENEIREKLRDLPGHREVTENLIDLRSMISHELPEAASKGLYQKLIRILLRGKQVKTKKIREQYLEPYLNSEKKFLDEHEKEFEALKNSTFVWVKQTLPEKKLQQQWNDHETWLPRRFKIYKREVSFQKIASDTLARFYLLKKV